MKKYEEYKDLKLPWLSQTVPAHWTIKRHKNILDEHRDYIRNRGNNYKMLSLTLNGVIIRDISSGKGKFSKDVEKYVIVSPGDFVFCLFDIDETPRTIGLSKEEGMITGAYDVFTPHDINSQYFYYYYLSLDNVKSLKPLYSGLRKVVGYSTFLSMHFPVPPREEQDQIVRYLDWKVSRINHLIHSYKEQINLLEEHKRTLVDNAVTKGLDCTAEMKNSGVNWLGEIPNNWRIISIAQIFTEVKCKNSGLTENNLLSLSYGKVVKRNIDATEGLLPDSFEGYNIIEKDDIVLRLTDLQNDQKSLRTGISKERGIITSAYITIRNRSTNLSSFLQFHLHAFDLGKGFYNVGASGVRQSLNWDTIKSLPIAVPPLAEQLMIVNYIDKQTEKIDLLKEKITKQIELLKEYRTRLISDVVTGQVDVRDEVIPDYTPEEDTVTAADGDDSEDEMDDESEAERSAD